MIEDSDSDSDIIAASPQVKKAKTMSRNRESPRKRKAIETTPDDFFGSGSGGRAKKVAKSDSNGKCAKTRNGGLSSAARIVSWSSCLSELSSLILIYRDRFE